MDRSHDRTTIADNAMCSFCARTPAALTVKLPVVGHTKKRAATPYCLVCYYTSSASRQDAKYVSIANAEEQQRQLPAMQTMFSECFLELQQEISKESVEAFSRQKNDPLAAMLTTSSKSSKGKRKSASIFDPNRQKKKTGNASDGGFLRDVELPGRLKTIQRQQALVQQEQLTRMAAQVGDKKQQSSTTSFTSSTLLPPQHQRRRKGSGKSIWNLAMAPTNAKSAPAVSHKSSTTDENNLHGVICTSCGSKDVHSFGNITSRNGDARKGEIWGSARESTVVTKYQCNKCGRTWNEEE